MKKPKLTYIVDAIILHNERVLILFRSPKGAAEHGIYDFPGGKIEKN